MTSPDGGAPRLSSTESQIAPALNPEPASEKDRWRILIVLLAAIVLSLIGVGIVNVALPSLQHDFGATDSDLQWILSGYALTFGVILVAAGRAGDIMGRGGLFLVGAALFTASSIAAGLAPDPNWLNGARFAQGLGSGLMNPQGIGMIQQYFHGADRAKAFGYFGTAVGVSLAIGPTLGGFLIQIGGPEFGWRLTFLVNVPIGIAVLVLGWLWFPRPLIARPKGNLWQALAVLDPVGSLLFAFSILCVLFPFVEAKGSLWTWLLLPLSFLLLIFWVRWEKYYARTGRSPMVDLDIFATASFRNGTIIMSLYFLGMTSIWVLIALYVQEASGKSALQAGLFGIPSALLSAYAAHWAGERVMRLGRSVVIGGLILALTGVALSVLVIHLHELQGYSVWWLMLPLAIVGIAQGSIITPNQTLTLEEVPVSYAGSSGAIMQTGQRVGTSIGIAVITAAAFMTLSRSDWKTAVTVGFALIWLVMLLALAVAVKDARDRRKNRAALTADG